MLVYFTMMRGLRGCYMPDDVSICGARDFREFASIIRYDCDSYDVRSTGQMRFAWNHVKDGRDWREVCVATDESGSYGLLVSPATEAEFQEYQTQCEDSFA